MDRELPFAQRVEALLEGGSPSAPTSLDESNLTAATWQMVAEDIGASVERAKEWMAGFDPTGDKHKYASWIWKNYRDDWKGYEEVSIDVRSGTDQLITKRLLDQFDKLKKHKKLGANSGNIDDYSIPKLVELLNSAASALDASIGIKAKGGEIILDSDPWLVIKIPNAGATAVGLDVDVIGQETSKTSPWCTRFSDNFRDYSYGGGLHFVLVKNSTVVRPHKDSPYPGYKWACAIGQKPNKPRRSDYTPIEWQDALNDSVDFAWIDSNDAKELWDFFAGIYGDEVIKDYLSKQVEYNEGELADDAWHDGVEQEFRAALYDLIHEIIEGRVWADQNPEIRKMALGGLQDLEKLESGALALKFFEFFPMGAGEDITPWQYSFNWDSYQWNAYAEVPKLMDGLVAAGPYRTAFAFAPGVLQNYKATVRDQYKLFNTGRRVSRSTPADTVVVYYSIMDKAWREGNLVGTVDRSDPYANVYIRTKEPPGYVEIPAWYVFEGWDDLGGYHMVSGPPVAGAPFESLVKDALGEGAVVCAWCKKVLGEKPGMSGVSHGLCPDCAGKMASGWHWSDGKWIPPKKTEAMDQDWSFEPAKNWLDIYPDMLHGVYAGGLVSGDFRAIGKDLVIHWWESNQRGMTRKALEALRQTYEHVYVDDIEEKSQKNWSYWQHMLDLGLVDGLYDEDHRLRAGDGPDSLIESLNESSIEQELTKRLRKWPKYAPPIWYNQQARTLFVAPGDWEVPGKDQEYPGEDVVQQMLLAIPGVEKVLIEPEAQPTARDGAGEWVKLDWRTVPDPIVDPPVNTNALGLGLDGPHSDSAYWGHSAYLARGESFESMVEANLQEPQWEMYAKQLVLSPDLLKAHIKEIDPTGRRLKYASWIVKHVINAGWDAARDFAPTLAEFEDLRRRNLLPGVNVDRLGAMEILQRVKWHRSGVTAAPDTMQAAKASIVDMNGKIVAEAGPWIVVELPDADSAILLCRAGGWCIKDKPWADYYLANGPLYIVLSTKRISPDKPSGIEGLVFAAAINNRASGVSEIRDAIDNWVNPDWFEKNDQDGQLRKILAPFTSAESLQILQNPHVTHEGIEAQVNTYFMGPVVETTKAVLYQKAHLSPADWKLFGSYDLALPSQKTIASTLAAARVDRPLELVPEFRSINGPLEEIANTITMADLMAAVHRDTPVMLQGQAWLLGQIDRMWLEANRQPQESMKSFASLVEQTPRRNMAEVYAQTMVDYLGAKIVEPPAAQKKPGIHLEVPTDNLVGYLSAKQHPAQAGDWKLLPAGLGGSLFDECLTQLFVRNNEVLVLATGLGKVGETVPVHVSVDWYDETVPMRPMSRVKIRPVDEPAGESFRSVVRKNLQESVGEGEWWIDNTGQAMYADGDVGDMNHAAYALETILAEYDINLDEEPEAPVIEPFHLSVQAVEWLRSKGVPNDVIEMIDTSDPREWMIQHHGWIRLAGTSAELWEWNDSTLSALRSGVSDAWLGDMDDEEFGEDDYIQVEEARTRRTFSVPLAVLMNDLMDAESIRRYGARGEIVQAPSNPELRAAWARKAAGERGVEEGVRRKSVFGVPKKSATNGWILPDGSVLTGEGHHVLVAEYNGLDINWSDLKSFDTQALVDRGFRDGWVRVEGDQATAVWQTINSKQMEVLKKWFAHPVDEPEYIPHILDRDRDPEVFNDARKALDSLWLDKASGEQGVEESKKVDVRFIESQGTGLNGLVEFEKEGWAKERDPGEGPAFLPRDTKDHETVASEYFSKMNEVPIEDVIPREAVEWMYDEGWVRVGQEGLELVRSNVNLEFAQSLVESRYDYSVPPEELTKYMHIDLHGGFTIAPLLSEFLSAESWKQLLPSNNRRSIGAGKTASSYASDLWARRAAGERGVEESAGAHKLGEETHEDVDRQMLMQESSGWLLPDGEWIPAPWDHAEAAFFYLVDKGVMTDEDAKSDKADYDGNLASSLGLRYAKEHHWIRFGDVGSFEMWDADEPTFKRAMDYLRAYHLRKVPANEDTLYFDVNGVSYAVPVSQIAGISSIGDLKPYGAKPPSSFLQAAWDRKAAGEQGATFESMVEALLSNLNGWLDTSTSEFHPVEAETHSSYARRITRIEDPDQAAASLFERGFVRVADDVSSIGLEVDARTASIREVRDFLLASAPDVESIWVDFRQGGQIVASGTVSLDQLADMSSWDPILARANKGRSFESLAEAAEPIVTSFTPQFRAGIDIVKILWPSGETWHYYVPTGIYDKARRLRDRWAIANQIKAKAKNAYLEEEPDFKNESVSETFESMVEAHWTDIWPKGFQDFRKKYLPMVRRRQGYLLYVQFSNHYDDVLQKNPYPNPDHSDPVGMYAYPLEYVITHPADVWYGSEAKYLRVLEKSPSAKILDLQELRDNEYLATNLLSMAFPEESFPEINGWFEQARRYIRRWVNASNAVIVPKAFFSVVQYDYSQKPVVDDYGRPRWPVRPGMAQTKLLRSMGLDGIEDTAKRLTMAVINDREPEQILFVSRKGFEVVDIFQLNYETKEPGAGPGTVNDPEDDFQKLAALVFEAMGDRLATPVKSKGALPVPRVSSAKGFISKGGKLFAANAVRPESYYTNLKFGQKPHRHSKLATAHRIDMGLDTDHGHIGWSAGNDVTFAEMAEDIGAWYQKAAPVEGWQPWSPKSLQDYEEKDKNQGTLYRLAFQWGHPWRDRGSQEDAQKQAPEITAALQKLSGLVGMQYTPPADDTQALEHFGTLNVIADYMSDTGKYLGGQADRKVARRFHGTQMARDIELGVNPMLMNAGGDWKYPHQTRADLNQIVDLMQKAYMDPRFQKLLWQYDTAAGVASVINEFKPDTAGEPFLQQAWGELPDQGETFESMVEKHVQPQQIFYHGTSSKALPGILSQGLIPMEDPKKKPWGTDPEREGPRATSAYLSRRSYPGTYLAQKIGTPISAANRAVSKFGGTPVIVAVKLSPRSLVADEDDLVFKLDQAYYDAVGYHGYDYHMAMVYLDALQNAERQAVYQKKFEDNFITMVEFAASHWTDEPEKKLPEQLVARVRELLSGMFLEYAARKASVVKDHDFRRAWSDLNPETAHQGWESAIELRPEPDQTEETLRAKISALATVLAGYTGGYDRTFRMPDPMGMSGRNRVIAVYAQQDPKDHWSPWIVKYGERVPDLEAQLSNYYGEGTPFVAESEQPEPMEERRVLVDAGVEIFADPTWDEMAEMRASAGVGARGWIASSGKVYLWNFNRALHVTVAQTLAEEGVDETVIQNGIAVYVKPDKVAQTARIEVAPESTGMSEEEAMQAAVENPWVKLTFPGGIDAKGFFNFDVRSEDLEESRPRPEQWEEYAKRLRTFSRGGSPAPVETLKQHVHSIDPSGAKEKYAQWILMEWRRQFDTALGYKDRSDPNQNYILADDNELIGRLADMRDALSMYVDLLKRNKIQGRERDIGQIEDLTKLRGVVSKAMDPRELITLRGGRIVHDTPAFIVVEVTMPQAAHHLGGENLGEENGEAEWCTRMPAKAREYMQHGKLYFVYTENQPWPTSPFYGLQYMAAFGTASPHGPVTPWHLELQDAENNHIDSHWFATNDKSGEFLSVLWELVDPEILNEYLKGLAPEYSDPELEPAEPEEEEDPAEPTDDQIEQAQNEFMEQRGDEIFTQALQRHFTELLSAALPVEIHAEWGEDFEDVWINDFVMKVVDKADINGMWAAATDWDTVNWNYEWDRDTRRWSAFVQDGDFDNLVSDIGTLSLREHGVDENALDEFAWHEIYRPMFESRVKDQLDAVDPAAAAQFWAFSSEHTNQLWDRAKYKAGVKDTYIDRLLPYWDLDKIVQAVTPELVRRVADPEYEKAALASEQSQMSLFPGHPKSSPRQLTRMRAKDFQDFLAGAPGSVFSSALFQKLKAMPDYAQVGDRWERFTPDEQDELIRASSAIPMEPQWHEARFPIPPEQQFDAGEYVHIDQAGMGPLADQDLSAWVVANGNIPSEPHRQWHPDLGWQYVVRGEQSGRSYYVQAKRLHKASEVVPRESFEMLVDKVMQS